MKPKGKLSEMTREEIVNLCRYYKGEESNPYEKDHTRDGGNKSMLWFYERGWVNEVMYHQQDENSGILAEYATEYINAGMADFRENDMIPISLKAMLFNRYMRDSFDGNTEPFKKFFNQYY